MGDRVREELPYVGFIAGLVAGGARVIVGHPFDTVKVLAQTGQTSLTQVLRPTLSSVRRVYHGVGPPLLSVCFSTATSFGLYEASRLALEPLRASPPVEVFLAGTIAGVAVSLPLCPLANVRVLQQTSSRPVGTVAWLAKLWQHRGLRALFRGLGPQLVQSGVGRGNYMAAFHIAKELEEASEYVSSVSFTGKLLAASSAGIAGWFFTYPFDVARSNIIRDWQSRRFSGSMFPALAQLYREGGIRCLYAGLTPTMVRAVPVAAVTLTTYDMVKYSLIGAAPSSPAL